MIFSPDYAEMHYKFKLPWSLLYKKEPEIILDAPFQIVPGENITVFIVVREANRFPVTLESFSATFTAPGFRLEKIRELQKKVAEPFRFFSVDCGKFPPGKYEVEASVKISIGSRKKRIRRFNLSGLKNSPLRICVLKESVPKPEGFIAGDVHAHTHYSADPVEFGVSPAVLQKAAKAVGLDFVFCTDHSYDFAFEESDYMVRADAKARYEALRKEISELPDCPRMIAGEEISAGNAQGKNVHLLLPGHPEYIPGEGDCGRKWLDNRPTLSIPRILSETKLPCFAAHPKETIGWLERLIFNRGDWESADLQRNSENPIRGLEFWNGSRDRGFKLGREFWISELERGNFLLPLGGNDAHGDLNEYTGVKIPLLRLKRSRSHIFGYVRTVIEGKDALNAIQTQTASLYITDGPALWWERDGEDVLFHVKSSEDFGEIKSFTVSGQSASCEHERPLAISPERISGIEATCRISLSGFRYVRAEAETVLGRFALTSACPAMPGSVHTETSRPGSCCR